jgi:hypothetical protein
MSSFKLSCNLFGIIPAVNSTGGTVQVVYCCNILFHELTVQLVSIYRKIDFHFCNSVICRTIK